MAVIDSSTLFKVSVLSLTQTSCDLKEFKGLCTSVKSRDLNVLCRCSEVLCMYCTGAYILLSLRAFSDLSNQTQCSVSLVSGGFNIEYFKLHLQCQWREWRQHQWSQDIKAPQHLNLVHNEVKRYQSTLSETFKEPLLLGLRQISYHLGRTLFVQPINFEMGAWMCNVTLLQLSSTQIYSF